MTYTAPTISEIGTLRDLTLTLNKIGYANDVFSNLTGISGSIVNIG